MPTTEATPAEYAIDGNMDKRRKLEDDQDATQSTGGPTAPPTPQGPPGYYPDPYAMPPRYYDDYREPPSMPYARGHHPAPSPKHHPHGGYAYPPPPPKEYYHGHHYEYPPHPAWGHYKAPPGGQPFSPRYGQPPYEYDRHYNENGPPPRAPPSKPSNAQDDSYQSPTSVVNALDTRSPEGSRNLNNFEERVGQHPMMYPHPHGQYYPPIHSPGHGPSRQWWSCDYCSYKFSTWEECSAHEGMCPNRACSSRGKKRSVEAIDDSCRFMHPSEEYANNTDRPIFSLALPTDGQSLSDRQCYVRTHFVELFIATEADVSARHSRGAQKLHLNQVGLRCAYCAKLKPRDRAERAVCYPSSISRIYQTVADMQRFHFETCQAIPPKVLRVYKSLKTTRPRGVGSPQSYWDKSARELGLMDSDYGIALKDGGILVHRKVEDAPLGMAGAAPIPSLMAQEHVEHQPSMNAGPWVENAAGVSTPQESQEGQEKGAAPSEADASILLMLKNPDAASPKSTDGDAERDEVPVKEEAKLAEV